MRRLALAASVALLAGCAHAALAPPAKRAADVAVGEARFRVEWWDRDDRGARQVIRALTAAAPRAQRWGPLSRPVTITLHRDQEALAAAVDREGYGWLRAWARYATIDLQSPGTWGPFGASDRKVEELLTHELTHCAMYQRAGDERTWMYRDIPRWFSEGLASVTAGQGYRYRRVSTLTAFYRGAGEGSGDGAPRGARLRGGPPAGAGDPLVDPEPLYRDRHELVYGAAHHAVELLLRRHGEDRVVRVVELMGEGSRFPAAFREALGIGEPEFAAEFRRYVLDEAARR